MERLEVSSSVRTLYGPLGVKGLKNAVRFSINALFNSQLRFTSCTSPKRRLKEAQQPGAAAVAACCLLLHSFIYISAQLQHTAAHCSTLQQHCSTLQQPCSTLQHTAAHCSNTAAHSNAQI